MYKYLGITKNYLENSEVLFGRAYYTYLFKYNGLQIELDRREVKRLLDSGVEIIF